MAHIVVIGAGVGGMPAAYEIKDALGKNHQITVVSNHEYFQFTPSNPWVAVGWRARKDICFPVAPFLKKRNIEFIPSGVQEIKPDENQIVLANGTVLDYDFLVIATGPNSPLMKYPDWDHRAALLIQFVLLNMQKKLGITGKLLLKNLVLL